MKPTPKAAVLGAGGVSIAVAIVHQTSLLVLVAIVLLVLVMAPVCLIGAVVFAKTDGPTGRFERVTAALAQLAPHRSIAQPPTGTAAARPSDGP